jgi:hypothetical protein
MATSVFLRSESFGSQLVVADANCNRSQKIDKEESTGSYLTHVCGPLYSQLKLVLCSLEFISIGTHVNLAESWTVSTRN